MKQNKKEVPFVGGWLKIWIRELNSNEEETNQAVTT